MAAALACGCSGPAAGTETESPVADGERPSATPTVEEPSVDAEACHAVSSPERFVIAEGGSFTSASGLLVRFLGESYDDFDDGRFDVSASMSYAIHGEPAITRMPSLLAEAQYEALFTAYCVRVARAEGGVAVEVAPIRTADAPSACAPPSQPRLDSQTSPLTDGSTYYVDAFRDRTTGAWMPAIEPQTVVHRTPRMVWLNLREHPELTRVTSEWVRFEVELVSHVLEPEGRVSLYSGEYRNRILTVCVPAN